MLDSHPIAHKVSIGDMCSYFIERDALALEAVIGEQK
jgi:hypothetical protein